MRALVIKPFKDPASKQVYKQGQVIEIADERFAAINGTSHGVFLQKVTKTKQPPKKKQAKKTTKKSKK